MTLLKSTRGLATVLALSLGANLFLAGMLAGRITGEATQVSPTRRSIEAMLASLPDAKRKLVRREIDAALPRVRGELAALKKARAVLAEEMIKPVPDDGALERGFVAVQLHTREIGALLQRAIVRALPSLTQDERRALVHALGRRRSGSALPLP